MTADSSVIDHGGGLDYPASSSVTDHREQLVVPIGGEAPDVIELARTELDFASRVQFVVSDARKLEFGNNADDTPQSCDRAVPSKVLPPCARWRDYFAFTRPLSIPVTLAMAMTGWLASRSHERLSDLIFLAVVYSFLLWGGTNAFNSAEDRDTGPVNLLPNPPPIPRHLRAFGLALMALAIAGAAFRDARCIALVAIAVVLSVFYSWRGALWPRGKDIPGVDNLINAGGCGLGSFLLGWCTTGAPLTIGALYLGIAWTVCLFGGMPTAQIFQLRAGERGTNWTSWLGVSRTLRVGAVLFAVHFVMIARVSTLGVGSIVWGTGVLAAIVHSAWWSRDPFTRPYARMLRQMTMLTIAQLAWAISAASG